MGDVMNDADSLKKEESNLRPHSTVRNGEVRPELEALVMDQEALGRSYGKPGIRAFIKSPTVVLSAFAAAMCGFLYGYDQGLINVTLIIDRFLDTFPEVDTDVHPRAAFWKGLVTAIFELGAVIGALQSAFFADKFSRRYTILIACAWYLVGGAIQAASINYTMLVFGRLIGGVGVGGASMIAPLYISEIANPNIRGALLTLQQWMLILGIVAAYYTTYGSRHLNSNWAWQTAFVAQLAPGVVLAGIVYYMPFSPRWLGMKGRTKEGLETLALLRQVPIDDPRIMAEWINIRSEVILQERTLKLHDGQATMGMMTFVRDQGRRWKTCFSKRYIGRIHVCIVLNAFQQWVGVNGFTYYSTMLFQQLGYNYEDRLMLGGLLSVVQLVGATVPIFCIDHFGRRPLLLFGSAMMMCCHAITAAAIGTSYTDWASNQPSAKAGTAFMFVFMFMFEISWGPIAWGLPAEILPSTIRAEGMALAAASNWSSNFIVGLIVPSVVQAAPYGSFTLFACTTFIALLWVFFFVPETNQKTLEDLSQSASASLGAGEESVQRATIVAELLRNERTTV